MGMKQTEVLKLALEVLEAGHSTVYGTSQAARAITAIREALAEQPNIAKYLEKDNSEQPAQQQEPPSVAELLCVCGAEWEWRNQDWELVSTPPASKPWVRLSTDEIYDMYNEPQSDAEMVEFARAIEAKLREKNA